MEKVDKRNITFKHSDSSLTSPRVRIILSNPLDSAKLANAVRSLRHNQSADFSVSKNTNSKIEDFKTQLQRA